MKPGFSIDWTTITPWAVLLVGELLLAWAGWLILRWGIRHGRRVGDEPRCRTCEYELTGITSNNCPECGSEIDAGSVVHGHRQRTLSAVLIGGVVLLVALAGSTVTVKRALGKVNRYFYYSPQRLVADFAAGDDRAFQELRRRYLVDRLADGPRDRFIDAMIDKVLANDKDYNTTSPPGAKFLAQLALNGELRSESLNRYLADMHEFEFGFVHEARQGEWLTLHISSRPRSWGLPEQMLQITSLKCDDGTVLVENGAMPEALSQAGREASLMSLSDPNAILTTGGFDVDLLAIALPGDISPGFRSFEGIAHIQFYDRPYGLGNRRLLQEWTQVREVSFNAYIVPKDAPRTADWLYGAALEGEMVEHLVCSFSWNELEDGAWRLMSTGSCPFRTRSPCDYAFEVIVDGKVIGQECRSIFNNASLSLGDGDADEPSEYVIFRPSLELKRRCDYLGPIWSKELRVGPLTLYYQSGDVTNEQLPAALRP